MPGAGSRARAADSVRRLTVTSCTPGTAAITFSTLATQLAHVIPAICSSTRNASPMLANLLFLAIECEWAGLQNADFWAIVVVE